MADLKKFREQYTNLRNDLIAEIKIICNGRELEFKRNLVHQELNDQESELYYKVSDKGFTISSPNGDYDVKFDELTDDILLILYEELAMERYFVFEGNED